MADYEIILDRNDMIARLTAKNKSDGSAITSADSTALTLYDTHGNEVVGNTWPETLTHQGSGVWEATIPFDISARESGGSIKPGDELIMEVTLDGGSGLYFYQRKPVRVQERN